MDVTVNYLAVFLAGVSNMVVGYVWYNPAVFGKTWMKLLGKTESDLKAASKNMGLMYGMTFIAALLSAYVLSHFLTLMGVTTVSGAVSMAFWAWLGFVATAMFANSLFSGKPMKLFAIESTYVLVALSVQVVILILFQ